MFKVRVRQMALRWKFRKNNTIGRGVILSPDTVLKGGVVLGEDTILEPGVHLGSNVRVGYQARLSRITVGRNSFIETGVICTGHGSGSISLGKECYIGIYCVLDWSENITIMDFVHIAGPSTGLWTHSSKNMCSSGIPLAQLSDRRYRPTAPIVIENNVFIGGNCTIYPGVTIGNHSVVAPNSAVAHDVPPHTMVGGVPAKVIKKLLVEKE